MQMYTKSGRSLWPALVGVLVALVLTLGVLLVVALTRGEGDPEGTDSTPVAEVPSPDSHEGQHGESHGAELGAAPTGCLAGPGTGADMVLTTQARAPHSPYGAVEVAASMMRWANQYPWPEAAQIDAITQGLLSADMAPEMKDLAGGFAARESAPGPVETGTTFTTSTRTGQWIVDPTSTDDRVTVHLSLGVVVDGAVSAEAYGMGSPVLVWENEAWRVVDMVPTATAALEAGGTSFTGGC